jgi:hypothetical protein
MKINPRNFHKRRLEYIPTHFTRTNIKLVHEAQKDILARWIYAQCNGRFGIIDTTSWENDEVRSFTTIGFEEPSDLTIFALAGMAQIQQ